MVRKTEIVSFLKTLVARESGKDISQIDERKTFHGLGLDSVSSLFLLKDVEEQYQTEIDPLTLFDNPTIDSFAEFILKTINGTS